MRINERSKSLIAAVGRDWSINTEYGVDMGHPAGDATQIVILIPRQSKLIYRIKLMIRLFKQIILKKD